MKRTTKVFSLEINAMRVPRDSRRCATPCRKMGVMLGVLLTTSMASCGNDDRILRVTCGQPGRERLSADFGKPNVAGLTVVLLNPAKFTPGTILRLGEGPDGGEGSGKAVYTLRTSLKDFWPPKRPTWAYGKVVGGDIRVEVDSDVAQAAKETSVDLKNAVIGKTVLNAGDDSERSDLRDPVGLINADLDAVAIIRTGQRTARFVVVSGVFYSDSISLFYAGHSIAINVLKVGNFYLHISYACPRETTHTEQKPAERKQPMLLLYVPVYFDDTRNRVDIDQRAVDMANFDLSG